jgi:hypothetical protein
MIASPATAFVLALASSRVSPVAVTGEVLRLPSTDVRIQSHASALVLIAMHNKTGERLLFGSALGVSDITVNVPGSEPDRRVEGGLPGFVLTNKVGQESGTFKDWCFSGGHLHALNPGETYYHVLEIDMPPQPPQALSGITMEIRVSFPKVSVALECPDHPAEQVYGGEVFLSLDRATDLKRRRTAR